MFNLASKYSKYVSPTSNSASAISISSGLNSENIDTWIKALDGNNKALDTLGVTINGSKKSFANNSDIKKAVNNALKQIQEGSYKFRSNQQLMNDLKNGVFGNIGWGL